MDILITDSKNTKKLEGGMIELLDANNKTFKVNINDIINAETFEGNVENLTDNVNSNINLSVQIQDSDNNILDEEQLVSQVKSGAAQALDVTFESTHSGRNKNHVVYSSDSMEKDSITWLSPFKKPLIKNHDMNEEPIGRTVDASFGQSEFVDDRDTINVTFRVTDSDAMIKFADSRYKTMSIGASANHITCNMCGKDILKDSKFKFCGHWRGEQYKNETASWTAKDLEYKEGSIVNNPADVLAQVKRIRVIKQKDGTSMSKDNENVTTEDSVLSDIDNLIDTAPIDPEKVEDNNEDNVVNDKNIEPKVPSVEDQLVEATSKISEFTESINNLTTENKSLSDELLEIKTSKELADKELSTLKAQAKRLAIFNKQLLVDSLKAIDNSVTDESLECKTAKEISDMIESFKANPIRTPAPTLQNPGAAMNDKNTIIEDEEIPFTENVKTLKDMEELLLKLL